LLAIKFTKFGGVALAVNLIPLDQPTATEDEGLIKRQSSSALTMKSSMERSSSQSTGAIYRLGFSVTDTGIGISPVQLAKLFKSFSQVQHMRSGSPPRSAEAILLSRVRN
jgi:signal transduction histidine kinase